MSSTLPAARPLRRSVRIACQLIRDRDFRAIGRHVVDLSTEGMLVRCERPVLTGEPVIVSFRVPGGSPIWFDAEGVVARVAHRRRPEDDAAAVGIVFTWAEPAGRSALERQLAWFQIARSRRRTLASERHFWATSC